MKEADGTVDVLRRLFLSGQRMVRGVLDRVKRDKTDKLRMESNLPARLALCGKRKWVKMMSTTEPTGKSEAARRLRQIQRGQLKEENGLVPHDGP